MRKNYKLAEVVISVIMLVFLWTFAVSAEDGETKTRIRVGYLQDYGINVDEKGTRTGYLVDYLSEISKYTQWDYQFVEGTWAECLERLENGQIDMVGMVHKTPERESLFEFSEREIGIEYGVIYVLENRDDIYYKNPQSLNGLKIASNENNYFEIQLGKYCEKNGIEVELIPANASEFISGLESGTFDAVLSGSTMNVQGCVLAEKISTDPFYFAVRKGDGKILKELDGALEKIFLEDAYFDSKLFQRHFGNKSIGMSAFNQMESEYLESAPVLKVACNPNWIPISYVKEEGGQVQGIAIDLVNRLSRETGIALEYSVADTFESGLSGIVRGDVQLMIGYDKCDDTHMQYTDSIMDIPMIIAGTGAIDLHGNMRVAIHCPTDETEAEIKRNYPNFEYVEYESVRDVFNAMKRGEEDYAILNYYAFDELKRSMEDSNFQLIITDVSFPVNIGVSKSANENICSIFNKSMKRISAEEISAIAFENSIGRSNKAILEQMIHNNLISFSVFAVTAVAVVSLFIIYLNHKNKKILQRMAFYDDLTGVYTMEKFRGVAEQLLKGAESKEYSMVALDINKFKYINDSYGYDLGNNVLSSLSAYLVLFKKENYSIGRISADNFVVILKTEHITSFFSYLKAMDAYIHGNISLLPMSYPITYSLGYYIIDQRDEKLNTLLDKVNFARKQKRAENINNITEYTALMDEAANWKKEVTVYMEEALAEGQFLVYYQPKYDFARETLSGAEALVRWKHPKYGMIPPARFIPIFEQNGFIHKLDLYMFNEVCRFLAGRQRRGEAMVPISSNLSRIHLENEALAEELQNIMKRYKVEPKWIEVELTESVLLEDQNTIIYGMEKIKDLGISISIDDFGSGYSSLSLLSILPVSALKIDKMFVDQATNTENGKKVIQKIIELAKDLNLHTVAEGVETASQVEMLRQMGCETAQGYYYSKPIPVEEFCKIFV